MGGGDSWMQVRIGDGASLAACLDGLPPVEAGIVRAVHDAAAGIPPEFWRCDSSYATKWSGAVFGALRRLGEEQQFEVMTAPKHGGPKEYRWDLLWTNEIVNDEPRRVVLACESEWGLAPDQVLYDFKKLTRVLADHRLLIFDPNSADTKGTRTPSAMPRRKAGTRPTSRSASTARTARRSGA